MRNFHCGRCGSQVFFESTICLGCDAMLAYLPLQCTVGSFEQIEGGNRWRRLGADEEKSYKKCLNYETHGTCNGALDADDVQDLCAGCRLTTVIPALTSEKNLAYWRSLESAKRVLLYSLQSMRLEPFAMLPDGRPEMEFQFKESGLADGEVMTGHYDGIITVNLAEANPVERERHKENMNEPYRTVLGHFRHESGHFYFQKLVAGSTWLEGFREHFGDERADYAESLQRYYAEEGYNAKDGDFISAYAASHPWEDWAETWAHYLHVVDTLETAYACGLGLKPRVEGEPKLSPAPNTLIGAAIGRIGSDGLALSYVLNSLNRSMGLPDAYPFTLSQTVLEKLGFVHRVVLSRRSPRRMQAHKPA